VAGDVAGSVPVLFAGMVLFGGGTTANLQARYAAVDLAEPRRRGRQLSLIVWATTIGAVSGPNLAPVADRYTRAHGLPLYAGPFAFSAAAFLIAALAIMIVLRPDPLLTARRLEGSGQAGVAADASGAGVVPVASGGVAGGAGVAETGSVVVAPAARPAGEAPPLAGVRVAARAVRANPSARLGIAAVAVGHVVMVGVMSMTPVHIGEYHHGDVLKIVGIVLSLHIAGMYALSPVVGWLTDRVGRRPVILGGLATLLTACAVAGTSGHRTPILSVGLALLGLGWSATMVAGSTLLSESVGTVVRPAAQGLSDLVMGLAGAFAGAVSGLVVSWSGYPTLTLLAAIATLPLVALALRPTPAVLEGS
jgi:Major Facilitator Superfamily